MMEIRIENIEYNIERFHCLRGHIDVKTTNIKQYRLNDTKSWIDETQLPGLLQMLWHQANNYSSNEIWLDIVIKHLMKQTGEPRKLCETVYKKYNNINDSINHLKHNIWKF